MAKSLSVVLKQCDVGARSAEFEASGAACKMPGRSAATVNVSGQSTNQYSEPRVSCMKHAEPMISLTAGQQAYLMHLA